MIRWGQTLLHLILGVAAIAAGQAFVRDPSGKALGMATDYLEGSPFPDYRIPGLFLAVVIGGANLLSAVTLVRKVRGAAYLSLGTGLLLVAWVAIQTAIIGFRHWSQAIWWVTFIVVAGLGAALVHREAPTPRTVATD
jgi:hypothetical protein